MVFRDPIIRRICSIGRRMLWIKVSIKWCQIELKAGREPLGSILRWFIGLDMKIMTSKGFVTRRLRYAARRLKLCSTMSKWHEIWYEAFWKYLRIIYGIWLCKQGLEVYGRKKGFFRYKKNVAFIFWAKWCQMTWILM